MKLAYIIAGPNGSGKTTFAKEFIKNTNLIFINADEIAKALSPSRLEKVRVKAGYKTILIYIYLESIEEAIYRIDIRVKKGGHAISQEDIKRRFGRSINNFWNIYRKKVHNWEMFFNSKDEFLQVAVGTGNEVDVINEECFSLFLKEVF